MENYYKILGLSPAASQEEIRRAYRTLARRYHPDVNPSASAERFRKIAEAYDVLNDPQKKRQFDAEIGAGTAFQKAHAAYARNAARGAYNTDPKTGARPVPNRRPAGPTGAPGNKYTPRWYDRVREMAENTTLSSLGRLIRRRATGRRPGKLVRDIAIMEISLSVVEAIRGVKRTIEIDDSRRPGKISVSIPPGVRGGSVIRFRDKHAEDREVVLIVRLAAHPFISVHQRGVVIEIPVTIKEALMGAKIQVPTVEEPCLVTIPPGSQSGMELRLKGKGVKHLDGTRGDLFVRLLVRLPESPSAVGLPEKVADLDAYYEGQVRKQVPTSLVDG